MRQAGAITVSKQQFILGNRHPEAKCWDSNNHDNESKGGKVEGTPEVPNICADPLAVILLTEYF